MSEKTRCGWCDSAAVARIECASGDHCDACAWDAMRMVRDGTATIIDLTQPSPGATEEIKDAIEAIRALSADPAGTTMLAVVPPGPGASRLPAASSARRRVYVCHPYAADPPKNVARVHAIARGLSSEGLLPIAPHIYLPQLFDEATQRDEALQACLELVGLCDEVRAYGPPSDGMVIEIEHAHVLGIPVVELPVPEDEGERLFGREGDEEYRHSDLDEAIDEIVGDMDDAAIVDPAITLTMVEVTPMDFPAYRLEGGGLDRFLEDLDDDSEYAAWERQHEATPALTSAWDVFCAVVRRELAPGMCRTIATHEIPVRAWLQAHDPETLLDAEQRVAAENGAAE